MPRELLSPMGRLVGGSIWKPEKTDSKGAPLLVKSGANKGQPREEYWANLAIPKTDPEWNAFYTALREEAAGAFATYFPQGPMGQCTHPRFAFKVSDGDGVDQNGKQNSQKEGWAGCWVASFKNGYAPRIYHAGHYDRHEQVTDENALKLGYWVRIYGQISGNGVQPGSDPQAVPGLYLNMQMISIEYQAPEITIGPDPTQAFAGRTQVAAPPGAFAPPAVGQVAPPPLAAPSAPAVSPSPPPPAAPPPVTPSGTGAPILAPAPPAPVSPPPAPPPPAAAPPPPSAQQYMTAAATTTYEGYIAAGWTDALLIQHGLMTDHVPH